LRVIVIGGGAAGIFTAINIAEKNPACEVIVLEKSAKLLSKVKVSGGGRCNVTNERHLPKELLPFYPRGGKKLYPVFKKFSTGDMVEWLSVHGVKTKVEPDQRIFPVTDDSQSIIDCFLRNAEKFNVKIHHSVAVEKIHFGNANWHLETNTGRFEADKVIVATGSSQTVWNWLSDLGLHVIDPVPSLFTFKIDDERLRSLQGISFEQVKVRIVGNKLSEDGPMLITHWGLSGPAILKLSSLGAIWINEQHYDFEILVNFLSGYKEQEVRELWTDYVNLHPNRKVHKYPLWGIPGRFWERLLSLAEVNNGTSFGEMSKKSTNKLIEELTQGRYHVSGKSTFKEEFVTAGGVDLTEVSLDDFSANRFPGLYLAGEVLNIDAMTGGFNFQACWSAGWLISDSISKSIE
jgi:predicted Rossmann fold flavoprotein